MKLINSRGRILLHVTKGVRFDAGLPTERTLYDYDSEGGGIGRTSLEGLQLTLACIKADNKSARTVGELPPVEDFIPAVYDGDKLAAECGRRFGNGHRCTLPMGHPSAHRDGKSIW